MKRRLTFIALTIVASTALYAACSFPSIEFASSKNTNGGDSAADGDGTSSTMDASDGAQSVGEASQSDGGRLNEASIDAACCDCDNDGYRNDRCDASTWDGPSEIDCDDLAHDINPGKGYTTGPWPNGTTVTPMYDWNCDGHVDEELKAGFKGCGTVLCNPPGYESDPGCSKDGNYFSCDTLCGQTVSTVTQACK